MILSDVMGILSPRGRGLHTFCQTGLYHRCDVLAFELHVSKRHNKALPDVQSNLFTSMYRLDNMQNIAQANDIKFILEFES